MIKAAEIQKQLGGKPKGWMVLLEADPKNVMEAGVSTIKVLTEKNHHGILLTAMSKDKLLGICGGSGVDLEKITVLDISGSIRDLENPFEVANVVIAVNGVIRKQKKNLKRFVYINSINTMLEGHGAESALRFLHGIITRIRIREVNGVLVTTQSTVYDKVKAELEQLCDKVIKI